MVVGVPKYCAEIVAVSFFTAQANEEPPDALLQVRCVGGREVPNCLFSCERTHAKWEEAPLPRGGGPGAIRKGLIPLRLVWRSGARDLRVGDTVCQRECDHLFAPWSPAGSNGFGPVGSAGLVSAAASKADFHTAEITKNRQRFGENSVVVARGYAELAFALQTVGSRHAAEEAVTCAIKACRRGGWAAGLADALYLHGAILAASSRPGHARKAMLEAVEVHRRTTDAAEPLYPLPLMGLAETCEAVGDAAAAKAYLQEALRQLDALNHLPTRTGVPAEADIARAKFGLARALYSLNAEDARVPVLAAQARAIYLECPLPQARRDSAARIDAWLDTTGFNTTGPAPGGEAGGEDPQGGLS